MKRISLGVILICAAALLAGCKTSRDSETAELRHEMRQQLQSARAQLQSSGATPAQLREIDKAIVALDRQMRQLERQVQAMEKQRND